MSWHYESHRHYLAAKGVKTSKRLRMPRDAALLRKLERLSRPSKREEPSGVKIKFTDTPDEVEKVKIKFTDEPIWPWKTDAPLGTLRFKTPTPPSRADFEAIAARARLARERLGQFSGRIQASIQPTITRLKAEAAEREKIAEEAAKMDVARVKQRSAEATMNVISNELKDIDMKKWSLEQDLRRKLQELDRSYVPQEQRSIVLRDHLEEVQKLVNRENELKNRYTREALDRQQAISQQLIVPGVYAIARTPAGPGEKYDQQLAMKAVERLGAERNIPYAVDLRTGRLVPTSRGMRRDVSVAPMQPVAVPGAAYNAAVLETARRISARPVPSAKSLGLPSPDEVEV